MVSYLSSHFLTGFLTICIYICGNGYFSHHILGFIFGMSSWQGREYMILLIYIVPQVELLVLLQPPLSPIPQVEFRHQLCSTLLSLVVCWLSFCTLKSHFTFFLMSPHMFLRELPQDRSPLVKCPNSSSSSSCLSSSSGLNSGRSGMLTSCQGFLIRL